jgi:thymidine phosphorylase
VTGTVPAPGLIAASVMSKKLAAGADAILLDVKVGEGAFMPDLASARELAVRMRDIGLRAGRPTACELTAMDSPLGAAVGNALEVAESCAMLAGGGPDDFRELVLGSAARMAVLSDLDVDLQAGRRLAEEAIASGEALRALERLVEAQGGDPRLAENPWDVLEAAPVVLVVPAPRGGSVAHCGALAVGRAAMRLGAGRERKEDPIDHAVGIVVHAKPGDEVAAGDALAHIHARDTARGEQAVAEVLAAYAVVDGPVARPPLLLETIG